MDPQWWLAAVQFVVMALAGLFVWMLGRDNAAREARLVRIEADVALAVSQKDLTILEGRLERRVSDVAEQTRHVIRSEYTTALLKGLENTVDRDVHGLMYAELKRLIEDVGKDSR